jgi:hypothetical protein
MARTPFTKQSDSPTDKQEFTRRNRAGVIAGDAGPAAMAAFARAGFTDASLVLRWSQIVGPDVARLAQPLRFTSGTQGGTLTLRAAPGAALFLAHEKRSLAERINAYLGRPAVAQIKYVQGALAVRPVQKNVEKKRGPLPANDPTRGLRGPDGLKQALEALARRRNSPS